MAKRSGIVWVVLLVMAALAAGAAGGAWFMQRRSAGVAAEVAPAPAVMQVVAGGAEADEEIVVDIPAESLERMRLAYGKVTEAVTRSEVRVPGTVAPNGYREVRVTSLVGGVATKVSAELGQTVKRGQPLATVFSQELAEAQTILVNYEAELEVEHKKLTRLEELVELGAASREELEGVEGMHQVHTAHVEQSRQRLLLLGLTGTQVDQVSAGRTVSSEVTIPAPIDGVVIARDLNLGQVVTTSQALFTVVDLSSVWVEGSLLENDFGTVRVGSRATITTPAYAGRVYRGAVEYIDPQVDPQTRTAKVRVVVENPDYALRLGMYMDLVFASAGARVQVVPGEAVQQIGAASVVYVPVEGDEGKFAQRTVTLGGGVDGKVAVEGLKTGERVVTAGSFLLRAEALRQHPQ